MDETNISLQTRAEFRVSFTPISGRPMFIFPPLEPLSAVRSIDQFWFRFFSCGILPHRAQWKALKWPATFVFAADLFFLLPGRPASMVCRPPSNAHNSILFTQCVSVESTFSDLSRQKNLPWERAWDAVCVAGNGFYYPGGWCPIESCEWRLNVELVGEWSGRKRIKVS